MDNILLRKASDEEVKKYLLIILKEFDDFCEKHNLQYFVTSGTLIGVIRHKGFIPWDDDIDVCMLRKDYEKLISIFNQECEKNMRLTCGKYDKKYPYMYAKIYHTNTVLKEHLYKEYKIGINIDVFPMDYWGENVDKSYKKIVKNIKMMKIKAYKISAYRSLFKNVLLIFGKILLCFSNIDNFRNKAQKLMIQDNDKDGASTYIGNLAGIYGKKERLRTECFSSMQQAEFESINVNIPEGYDEILHSIYGDYMKLPPENERLSTHASEAFIIYSTFPA